MVFNTATVGSAVAPAVIQTFLSHYLNRKPLAQKPTAHISYDEGLHLIRKFLIYASHHRVEDIQRFTAQWVPHPTWVLVNQVTIPQHHISEAAVAITNQLGPHGVRKVGGKNWWQWRRPGSELKAEWIEMRTDANERKRMKDLGKRIMLYVHGGAFFFGSTDEHRYQMQRHARKLKARVFAREFQTRYRLAPQFPFPCGLHDCLSAYLYLLTVQDPTTIILAGDSAGGGMVLSMLVTLRDQGIPLPAGAILISPWVDLTHSFPSVSGDNPLDYIPAHGFHQRPSASWPPPNSDDMLAIEEGIVKKLALQGQLTHPHEEERDAIQGFHVNDHPTPGTKNADAIHGDNVSQPTANTVPGIGDNLSIMIDGKLIEIKDQIQMYAPNHLLAHPLVSPVLQPSLGGLPPLLILTGGGEVLRDEQIYLAHKAANPSKYPPGDVFLDENPHDKLRDQIHKWKPTDVQLQVWEDLCHVAPTLSFTRPAKYMYRSIAQFGAWALARAQQTEIEILDDDDVSVISQSESDEDANESEKKATEVKRAAGQVGKAGDPLPPFKNHMIRQHVDRHGNIFELQPASQLPACNMAPSEVGVIKEGPVRKWIAAKKEWDTKFASQKRKVQLQRAEEIANGYQQFEGGEVPPPSALAGRRKAGIDLKEAKNKRSIGMSLWALWGSKHDEKAVELEQEADREPETTTAKATDGAGARPLGDTKTSHDGRNLSVTKDATSRSRSRRRTVTDQNQTGTASDVDENTPASALLAMKATRMGQEDIKADPLAPKFVKDNLDNKQDENINHGSQMLASTDTSDQNPEILLQVPTNDEHDRKRPKSGGIAFPFSLKGHHATASMTTLTSEVGVPPAEDISAKSAMETGIRNDAAESARSSTPTAPATATKETAGNAGPFVANGGEVLSKGERPPLETFVTADSTLPTTSQKE